MECPEVGKGLSYRDVFHKAIDNDTKGSKSSLLSAPDIFMKNLPITCELEICDETAKFRSTRYNVVLTHGSFKWTIKRSTADVFKLYTKLEVASKIRKAKDAALPKFPFHHKDAAKENRRIKDLQNFLNDVLRHEVFIYNKSTINFLEVSWLSFIDGLGKKHKEGVVRKKVGDQRVNGEIVGAVHKVYSKVHTTWSNSWLVLKDTYLVIVRPTDNLIREVILMDNAFHLIKSPKKETRHSMKISNLNRSLVIDCKSRDMLNEWVNEINLVAYNSAEDFVQPNRLESFAPVRKKVLARWFVDGEKYYECVTELLDNAKEEIFITDWMLSPELYLKRPITDDFWRLDKVLERQAIKGVRVFVIIFEDVKIAMGLDSIYTRRRLMNLHPNIKVLRRRGFAQIMFWSPHDKMVIIDQQYAFFGGLDMCFGRWDNYEHRLIDLGNDSVSGTSNFKSVIGAFATRMATVPLNPTNYTEINVDDSKSADSMKSSKSDEASIKYSSATKSYTPDGKVWPGKDYMNFIYKDFQHVDEPFEDLIDRKSIPRMPWHDIACFVQGFPARDLARHFIQRWNVTKLDVKKEDPSYPMLLPKNYGEQLKGLKPALTLMTRVDCQMLRSASKWSAGICETESSIHRAYIKAISEAEHFIYIENQFFVSLMGGHPQVFNKIADCLYERIVRAYNNKKTFRVYVVMPLLPGIEGDIKSDTGVAIKAVTHYNYASICRGQHSLWARLEQFDKGNLHPLNYIIFCALRTHEITEENLVTELVYVHSKLMIVDDRVAIIGSANINDRSMNGGRDCEIAAIFEDVYEQKDAIFDNEHCRVGIFVSSLREHIFREHLGMMANPNLDYDLSDPVCENFFKGVWLAVALENTNVYEKVFRCIPNDSVTTIAQLEAYVKESPLSEINKELAKLELEKVNGHLVLLPHSFLCDEDLAPAISTKEGIMPNNLWT